MTWYIKARNLVYGPYSTERLQRFRSEGRLNTATFVCQQADGVFHPAGEDQVLQNELNAKQTQEQAPSTQQKAPSQNRHFIIYATISEAAKENFAKAIARFEQHSEPMPSMWLIRTDTNAHEIRNLLSRQLGADDHFMVFEVNDAQTAWFNIGETADRQIRKDLV